MTVMSTSTRELDINRICLLAYRRATLMPIEQSASGVQWDARAAHARDELEVIVDHIQAEGNITRDMELYDVTLVSSQAQYTMPSDTLRVDGVAMYLSEAGAAQTQVQPIDRDTYQKLSDKTLTGRPFQYYADRGASVVLSSYLVPDTSGAVLTVQRQRLLMDNSDGSATVDLERSWTAYLIWSLAHVLAVSSGRDAQTCGYIRSQSEKAMSACRSTANESEPFGFHVNHGVRY